MIKNINRVIEYLIYLYIFLLPWQMVWIISEGFIGEFKWHQGTYLLYGSEVLLLVIFILQLASKLKEKRLLKINRNKLLIVGSIWALAIFSGVSVLYSSNRTLSLYWWLRLLEAIILLFIILNAKVNSKKIAWTLIGAGVIQSALAISQFLSQAVYGSKWLGMATHLPAEIGTSVVGTGMHRWLRAYGSFTSPNILGGFLVVCFISALYVYFYYKPGRAKILSSVSLVIIFTGLFFSFSRSAWLATVVAFSIFILFYLLKRRFTESIRILAYILMISIALFIIYQPLVMTRLSAQNNLESKSIEQRIGSLSEAKDIILTSPVWGVGVGNYTNYLLEQKPEFEGWHYQPAHNIYLMVMAELGAIGLIIFVAILLIALYYSLASPFSFTILLSLLIIGLFDHYLWTSYFGLMLFWLAIAFSFKNFGKRNIIKRIFKKTMLEAGYQTGRNYYKPDYLSLVTTFKCNFRCRTCDIYKSDGFGELGLADWLEISDKLKNSFPASTFVEINGGEALLRRDMSVGLIKSLKNHFDMVVLNTNGSTINREVIDELKAAGVDGIKLSLYSLDKDAHNFLRGTDIAFDNAIRAVKLISSSGIKLEIGILVTNKNILQIPALIEHLKSLNNVAVIIQPLDEVIESTESKDLSANNLISDLWPNKESSHQFFNWLLNNMDNIKNSDANIRAIKKYYLNPESALEYRCFTGQRNLVIYPSGDVAMCFKGGAIGNIKTDSIDNILKNKATSERRKIKDCKKYCRIIGCNFSRGWLEVLTRR